MYVGCSICYVDYIVVRNANAVTTELSPHLALVAPQVD